MAARSAGAGGGEEGCGGVTVDEFEDPADRDVLDEEAEFGEGECEQVMELVDEPGALPDDGLETAGDLAEETQFVGHRRRVSGPFADGISCGGAGLDGIGLLGAEECDAIVLVALRIAAGDGEGGVGQRRAESVSDRRSERMQEVQQVVGILPGGVEADDEVDGAEALGDEIESLAELVIAAAGLGEEQFGGGGLQIGSQEGGVVAVARGVDADADARRCTIGVVWRGEAGSWCGSIMSPEKGWLTGDVSRESPPRKLDHEEACDERSEPQDVTSSWYNAEGSNCSKRSSLSRPKDLLATPLSRILPT